MINVKNIETESHEDLQLKDRNMEIITALASDYTSLFYLVLSTGELYLYNMQSSVAEKYENSFNYCDFENAKQIYCERDVYPEDRAEYLRKLELDFIRRKLNKNREYSFIYRMTSGDGYEYCEVKCIRIDREGKPYAAVVAYANVDQRVRADREQMKQLQRALHYAETDALTGILNRGGGEMKARRLITSGSPGMFMMFDIDGFKGINDKYGHQCGDAALVEVAAALKNTMRSSDVVMRFGGDEFVACVEGDISSEVCENLVGRLFEEINKIHIKGMDEPISISVGVTRFPLGDYDSFEQIYSRTDAAMYESKKYKGNRLVFA